MSILHQQVLAALGTAPKVLTYRTSAADTANLTTYTFSSQAIGAAAADRRVIVGVNNADGGSGVTISSVTIGGVSASISIQVTNLTTVAGIAIALVPTGTTGDVVVTFSAGKLSCQIGIWSCTGLISNTPVDTDSSIAQPSTATLTTVAGGFCIGAASSTGGAFTWTAATERYDLTSGSGQVSGADEVTTGSDISPSASSAAGGDRAGVFATF